MHIIYNNGDELFHYGTPRHSGRYPWGSGQNPYQHGSGSAFLAQYREMSKQGYSEKEIAEAMEMSTTEFRRQRTLYRDEEKAANRAACIRMREHGYSQTEIAKKLDLPSRSVSMYLQESYGAKLEKNQNTKDQLKALVEKNVYLDVGEGVENQLGISEVRKKAALDALSKEGYHVEKITIPQATDSKKTTTMMVLVDDTITKSDVWANRDKIVSPLGVYTEDGGRTWEHIKDPVSISSDRIMVRYADEGGAERDGLIELRRGVGDIALGDNHYAQVRIAVDGTHYLKGMAVYSDDLPDGVDIRFNTSKDVGTPMLGDKHNTVLKPLKDDPDNPFGSTIRQRDYIDKDGNPHQSAINLVNNDEDWAKWNKTLSSQVLSKQSPELAKRQLGIVYDTKKQEYNDISKITVPAVKEKMLNSLAEDCDSSAVHLKAAALPRQATQVILPLTSLKDNEVYAPNYKNGEQIALIRYPHEGRFQIPILTVNNRNKEGREILGTDSKFAIGIGIKAAQKLSGADFDGDTVTAIPLSSANIQSKPMLEGLKDFDAKVTYKAYDGMPEVGTDGFQKQKEMGIISNLITDATLQGATTDELARMVRYSQTVIDAEKHNLNWKLAEKDNGIQALKNKYQPKEDPSKPGGGAHTLISKSKGIVYINEREDSHRIDDEGNKIYYDKHSYTTYSAKVNGKKTKVYEDYQTGDFFYLVDTGEKYPNGKPKRDKVYLPNNVEVTSKERWNKTTTTNMEEAKDAFDLSSGTRMEAVYATHANKLKQLARDSRLEAAKIKAEPVNRNAAKIYAEEVASLKNKLDIVKANSPRERQAQALASKIITAKLETSPNMDKSDEKKMRQRVITEARSRVGSQSKNPKASNNISIRISDSEWEAITANAVPTTTLRSILQYADMDRVRELAIPKEPKSISSSKIARAKGLLASGYTQAEVAEMLGVSVSTLRNNGVL